MLMDDTMQKMVTRPLVHVTGWTRSVSASITVPPVSECKLEALDQAGHKSSLPDSAGVMQTRQEITPGDLDQPSRLTWWPPH